jgi:DNA-binding MarR family transcriptional regulator
MSTDTPPPELSDARSSTLHVYEILAGTETWVSDEALRDRTNYSRYTISRACRELQKRGLAQRRQNPDEPPRRETQLR